MYQAKGEICWLIPDAYIPEKSSGDLTSHESVCVINSSSEETLLRFTIYFEDRDPMEDILIVVPARRTKHIRTSSLEKDGARIPVGVPYAIEVQSELPIIVQYSRLDSTQPANALMSTMAFPVK